MNEFKLKLLQQTKEYCNKGLKIFPINYKSKYPIKDFKWKERATNNFDEIQNIVKDKNAFNLAMRTGKINNVFVIDIDKRHNGFKTLEELERKLGKLPKTVTVNTSRGGKHFYFQYPDGYKIIGATSLLGDGFDTRTDNNYIIIPPSTHETGTQYQWEKGKSIFERKLEKIPQTWLNALVEASNKDKKNIQNNTGNKTNSTISEIIPKGQRNTELHRLACSLVYKCNSEEDLIKIIQGINVSSCSDPLPIKEIKSLVKSAWNSNSKFKKKNNTFNSSTLEEDAEKLIKNIKRRKCGQKFQQLFSGNWEAFGEYINKEDADKSFMCMLAKETNKNIKMMNYIFRKSKMYNVEYEKTYNNTGMTYIELLIKNTMTLVTDIFPTEKTSMSDVYLDFILSKIKLFHNELEESFAIIEVNNHNEIYSLDSIKFKRYISMIIFNEFRKTISNEQLSTITSTLTGIALFESEEKNTYLRCAMLDNNLYYDLTNDKWQIVKINSNGWEIINNSPVLFKREKHHKPQEFPNTNNNDINLIWKYINIPDNEKLLFISCLCSMYIPNIPRPIFILYGEKGASKTTTSNIIRELVDPSIMKTINLVKDEKEFAQILSKHYLAPFDNLAMISNNISDMLCRAVTRRGFW